MHLSTFFVAALAVASSVGAFSPISLRRSGLVRLTMSESVNDFAAANTPTPETPEGAPAAPAPPSLITLEADEADVDLEALSEESSRNTFTTKTGESRLDKISDGAVWVLTSLSLRILSCQDGTQQRYAI